MKVKVKSEVFCDYSMLVTSYKIGGVHFRLLGTNGFHVKAKNERTNAAPSRCRQNLKHENFTSSFGRLRQNIAPKSVPHAQHDYFPSFNQSNHWFVASSLTLPSSNLKLHDSEVNTVDRGLRFSRNDRKVEVIKLFIIWHQQQLLFALFLQARNRPLGITGE